MKTKRYNIRDIRAKKGIEPLVCLTAYTAPMAKILDNHVDVLLVGDSLGMVLYGMENTLPVSIEMMIAHGKAVVKSSAKALVVVDMPFASYQKNKEQAFENCARVLAETGCNAVKVEGGIEMAETVAYLTKRGIAVMGHVGLLPQSVNSHGGYYVHGRSAAEYRSILRDAKAIDEAGAFSLVLEGIVADLAAEITKSISIPTIGIGSSVECDGQVLVTEDMLGLTEESPKFVKKYADLRTEIESAIADFSGEVRNRTFPQKPRIIEAKKSA